MPQISLTDVAKQKLLEYLSEEPDETVVRILVEDDGKYGLSLDQKDEGDLPFSAQDLSFVIEATYGDVIEGLRIDYLDQGASSGFSLTGGKPPAQKVVLRSEETPNPDARKFVIAFSLGAEGKTWSPEEAAEAAEPIQRVLALPEVVSVFQLNAFVTVTRTSGTAWEALIPTVTEILSDLEKPALAASRQFGDSDELPDRLARFVETDVAPFLRQDGGDIELLGIDDGIVKVKLVGACGTCPSSVMTLRMGVERRLTAAFPNEVTGLELVESASV